MDTFEVKVDPIKRFEFARRHGVRRSIVDEEVGNAKQKKPRVLFWKMRLFVQCYLYEACLRFQL